MSTYESQTIAFKNLYNDGRQYYSLVLPEYQRSYLWKKQQFEKLIESLLENFSSLDTIPTKSFFLGAIIFSKSNYIDNTTLKPYDIVDGQQRLTSISSFMNVEGNDPKIESKSIIKMLALSNLIFWGCNIGTKKVRLLGIS